MIKKYRLPIQAEGGLLRFEHSYALYGELMSRIDSDIADMLHMEGFTPLSQHLELNRKGAAWIVTTFDDTVSEAFLCAVHEIKGIYLIRFWKMRQVLNHCSVKALIPCNIHEIA